MKTYKNIIVCDNGGETFDRYTVIIRNGDNYDVYTMSAHPFSPLGMNQYSHTADNLLKIGVRLIDDIGTKNLPEEVKKAIKLRMRS